MNEMRKLMEAIEQINEVSDFDGPELDDFIKRWEQLLTQFNIDAEDMRKQWDLMRVIFNRANQGVTDLPISEDGRVSSEQHKEAIVALVDVLARDAVEQVEDGAATLDIATKNLVHQAMADIKMRLPERVDHYIEYGAETPEFYYGDRD